MKENNSEKHESELSVNQHFNYIKSELNSFIQNPRLIRTLYQFAFMMIGYYTLTLTSEDYSVTRTLTFMGLFFAIGLLIPLPDFAKIQGEAFSKQI